MKKVIAIVGPTGVGKSELAVFLGEKLNGEIVNFDSLQFYKELNIGTAKPGEEERKRVPHHLYDLLELDEEFNAAKFVEIADNLIKEIWERGKIPILVGGTGLYLRAFEYGLFSIEVPKEIRGTLRKRADQDLSSLYEELKRLDPEYAQKISPKDKVRITRALEVIYTSGKPISYFHKENPFFGKKRYNLIKIGLILPRKELYEKINLRVIKMIEKGWIEEVKKLLEKGYSPKLKPFKAIGYKYIIQYLQGKISLEKAIELIQRDTRRYAKRQLTWFKKEPDIYWFNPDEKERILNFLKEKLATN
ncbi:tRNA dimethylallyltransferase [Thermodesulfobacterium geofontis OPF15]|uniref:tRNA dimethylallyltransferase n=1 Tax=Thermodesulfobacterium geofontis (strain OPF15) TaxID=795359 RepID=F8C2V7_THEGP|nr:tRNA (adenosine(37)-N6)-dimethylallyltransferase MiaA [Thermodesulfobacterium geofontis]AEH22334.1 tRNA dimethylallyltransferase [Thermodesulfobacterium geofontis OPF15]